MKIGDAARLSGISAKMIRYYEEVGLLAPAARRDSGYRDYSAEDVEALRFVKTARDLGFPLRSIGELVALRQNDGRQSKQVKAVAQAHIATLKEKAAQMLAMADALEGLAQSCAGDDKPRCSILDGLGAKAAKT